jgi:hypothetical protein
MMNLRDLEGWSVLSEDNAVSGTVIDAYFDHHHWTVRYLLVDVGEWLGGRPAPVSPAAVVRLDRDDSRVHVSLTRRELETAPAFDLTRSATRKIEETYASHLRFPYYWAGPGTWGAYQVPSRTAPPTIPAEPGTTNDEVLQLRSARDVSGSHIHATDGEIGHVESFLFDETNWRIDYLIVDTSNWFGGRTVLVPTSIVRDVAWPDRAVYVDASRALIKGSPECDASQAITPAVEAELQKHYAGAASARPR